MFLLSSARVFHYNYLKNFKKPLMWASPLDIIIAFVDGGAGTLEFFKSSVGYFNVRYLKSD